MARSRPPDTSLLSFRDWAEQAQRDLDAARQMSLSGFHEWAHYCALQSSEKIEKAVYVALGVQFPFEHDLLTLSRAWADVATSSHPGLADAFLFLSAGLNNSARYPDADGPPCKRFSAEQSVHAVKAAQTLIEFCSPLVERAGSFREGLNAFIAKLRLNEAGRSLTLRGVISGIKLV